MKKFSFVLLLVLGFNTSCFGLDNLEMIGDESSVIYSPSSEIWTTNGNVEGGIVLTKKVQYGAGAYSQYFNQDDKLAFTLTSDCEFIENGKFVSVNNNELKYTKIVYSDNKFEETPLTIDELQELFPDTEIITMSQFKQGKYWTDKDFFTQKKILLVNDTKKFYYNPTCDLQKAQTSPIKGLITLYKFGKYHFNHFGEHKGNFCIYVR